MKLYLSTMLCGQYMHHRVIIFVCIVLVNLLCAFFMRQNVNIFHINSSHNMMLINITDKLISDQKATLNSNEYLNKSNHFVNSTINNLSDTSKLVSPSREIFGSNEYANHVADQYQILYKTKEIPKIPNKMKSDPFQSIMSDIDKVNTRDVLRVFIDLLVKHQVAYMMYGGTLLGSYRHHGMIPWDDDVDILMAFVDRTKLKHVVGTLAPKYLLNTQGKYRWKFYSRYFNNITGVPCKLSIHS